MRISDWSSDVCSSDLKNAGEFYPFLGIQEANTTIQQWNRSIHRGWYIKGLEYEQGRVVSRMPPSNPALRNASFEIDPRIRTRPEEVNEWLASQGAIPWVDARHFFGEGFRSEEHTSELQSLMSKSYAVFCLQKKNKRQGKKITRVFIYTRIVRRKRVQSHHNK